MVKAWREQVIIPTYEVGAPEKNPIFLENRVYQGSSGVVYPYPVIESISDERVDKEYNAIYIENEYIKVMILPELGGRVQMAYDKVKQRHFVYYNHVIKPALVGLAGPWISGGIEFNWPQHHRPTTFAPVDWRVTENPDGSKSVELSGDVYIVVGVVALSEEFTPAINNINDGFTFIESMVSALGVGLGFLLAMVLFSGLRSRIDESNIPAPFKGLAVTLIAASFIPLAFMGFGGIVENIFVR